MSVPATFDDFEKQKTARGCPGHQPETYVTVPPMIDQLTTIHVNIRFQST